MRFILYDRRDHTRQLIADATTWRAMLGVLHQSDVLTKEQANRLVWLLGGEGTSIGEAEARLIGDYLTMYLLPQLKPGESIAPGPEDFEFEEVTDGTINLGLMPTRSGMSATDPRPVRLTREWLTSLAELCSGSAGVGAISESARGSWSSRRPNGTPNSE